jgi:catechol 2,3-dioxygenase-like lactoylglutathione lyase family enzyme
MEPRVSLITLGVADVPRARAFYEALGWRVAGSGSEDVAFFQAGGTILALWGWGPLAEDAGVPSAGQGFRGTALAYNVRDKAEVAWIVEAWVAAGGTVTRPAQDTFWGGHTAYVADPDGHLWEIAWNPGWPIAADGSISLPG